MIQLENKLEYLAESLVPDSFIQNAPQFYNLIKAFLVNIQDVQDSININFLDTIDLSKINNNEVKKIYIDTFLNMMNLEDEEEIDGLLNLVRVNKELSELKGTALIFTLLSKLLVYVLSDIGTQYNNLYKEYLEATGEQKLILEQELEAMKLANLNTGQMLVENVYDVDGNIVPFKYSVVTNFDGPSFYKYIYDFAHPAGWLLDFTNAYTQLFSEKIETYESLTIFESIDYPLALADGSTDFENTDDLYPDNVIPDPIMGLATDIVSISSPIFNTDRLYIDGLNVKYRYHSWNGEDILGTTGKLNTNAEQRTPTDNNWVITGGGYVAETTGIASANGALDAGNMMITYQSFVNDIITEHIGLTPSLTLTPSSTLVPE